MAVTYGFFNSVNGDRKYNADQMSEFFRGIVSQGVFQHLDSGMAVSAGTGLSVSVAAGRAIIQDRWIQNSAALNLTISAASETYARKDAVVIRLDKSSRAISIAVKTGTPAASPVAPSMTRTDTTYEMALAYVNVAAGATSVTVTDKRSDSSVCGWASVAQATSGEVDQMLNDMKTGFDGVVYDSPVEMVQGEDQKLDNKIDNVENNIISIMDKKTLSVIQYLDDSTRQETYLWTGNTTKAHNAGWTGYYAYDAISVKAGTYTFYNYIYAAQSYVSFDGGSTQTSLKTYLSISADKYIGDITLSQDAVLYISTANAFSQRARITKKYGGIDVSLIPYDSGIFMSISRELFKNDQAYIQGHCLTCNNDHKDGSYQVAKYIQTDMGSNAVKVMCKAKWGGTLAGSIALITTPLHSSQYINNIVNKSVHAVFTPTHCDVGLMDNGQWSTQRITYTLSPDYEYTFGIEINGTTLSVYTPNGAETVKTDITLADLQDYNGQYVIFEHYMTGITDDSNPSCLFNHPVFTGFYASCQSGRPLRDNFKREDGSISVSPTGHVYTLYRNQTSSDTRYDNSNGQIN